MVLAELDTIEATPLDGPVHQELLGAEVDLGQEYAERVLGLDFAILNGDQNPYTDEQVECFQPAILLVTDGTVEPSAENTNVDFFGEDYVPFKQRTGPPVHVLDVGAVDGSDSWLADVAEATGGTYSYVPTATDLESWVTAVTPTTPDIAPTESTLDSDGDGLSNWVEIHGVTASMEHRTFGSGVPSVFYSDPNNADTDGDGLSDGVELGSPVSASVLGGWTSGTPITVYNVRSDPRSADGDGDGLPDMEEIDANWNALNADPDGDGLNDAVEAEIGTFPTLVDTDGDSFTDEFENSHLDEGYDPLEHNDVVPTEEWLNDVTLGAFCGDNDVCRRDSIPWLVGNIFSSVAIYGDIRDFVAATLEGNTLNQLFIAVGFVPLLGDAGGATAKISRALSTADGAFATTLVRLLYRWTDSPEVFIATLRLSMPDLVDEVVDACGSTSIAAEIFSKNSIPALKSLAAYPHRAAVPYSGITVPYMEKSGKAAESFLKNVYGQPNYAQTAKATSMGDRYSDLVVVDDFARYLHESKGGHVSGSRSAAQISKDAQLLSQGWADVVTWHFFASAATGKIGPAPATLEMLRAANIEVIVHWPNVGRG